MARTESKRELILQDLQTTLEAIDGKDPYWTEVKSVKRVPTVPEDLEGEEKPGLLIVATGEPETIEHQHAYQEKRDLRVGIIGILDRSKSDEGTEVNRFMKDVGRAIHVDVTRGGYASDTRKVQQLDASNLFGDLGIFEIELSIPYHCDAREE
jgi:hypothetical protein